MKNYESLVDALTDLRKRGYEAEFESQPFCLYCGDLDIRLNAGEFKVDEVYRFERDPSPKDNSIVFAISSSTGVKGTLVDTYGAYAENINFETSKKMQAGQPVVN